VSDNSRTPIRNAVVRNNLQRHVGFQTQCFDPDSKGRHWAIPKKIFEEIEEDISGLSTHRKLDLLYARGLLTITKGDEWPRYTGRIIGPKDGQPLSDLWAYQPYTEGTVLGTNVGIDDDVRWMGTSDAERLGYASAICAGVACFRSAMRFSRSTVVYLGIQNFATHADHSKTIDLRN